MDHPIKIMDVEDEDKHINLQITRIFSTFGILLHFGKFVKFSLKIKFFKKKKIKIITTFKKELNVN